MIDFHRTFPPEAPLESEFGITTQTSRSVYYQLLRPELVRSNHTPLSSDAFTRWGSFDEQFNLYNEDVKKGEEIEEATSTQFIRNFIFLIII